MKLKLSKTLLIGCAFILQWAVAFAQPAYALDTSYGVKLGEGYFVPLVTTDAKHELGVKSQATGRVTKITLVRKGESCIGAFARLGLRVTALECEAAAYRAGVATAWSRPDLNRGPIYITFLRGGDKIGVYFDRGKKTPVVFPRDTGR